MTLDWRDRKKRLRSINYEEIPLSLGQKIEKIGPVDTAKKANRTRDRPTCSSILLMIELCQQLRD